MSESASNPVSSSENGTATQTPPPSLSPPSTSTAQAPPPSQNQEATAAAPPPPPQSLSNSSSNSSTSSSPNTGQLGAPPPTSQLGVPPPPPPPPSPLENGSFKPPPSPPSRTPPTLPTKNSPPLIPQEPPPPLNPSPSPPPPPPILVPSMPPNDNTTILLPPPISSDPTPAAPLAPPAPSQPSLLPAPPSNITPPLTPPTTPLPLEAPPVQQASPGASTPPVSNSLPSPPVGAINAASSPVPVTLGNQPTSTSSSNGNINSPPLSQNSKTSPSLSSESPRGGSSDRGFPVAASVSALAAIIVIAAILFVIVRDRKKNRRRDGVVDTYWKPPANFSVKSDGYYQQGNTSAIPGHVDAYYISGTPPSTTRGTASDCFQGHGGYSAGPPDPGGKSWFSYEELMEITNGFSRSNLIGEGGFGCVYKGAFLDGKQVAVKQLKAGSGQGEREFRAEVEIISRVHHRHLVSLVGFCIAENHRLLVYEFVPNNTLDHHLHGKDMPVMDWPKRLKIAIGSARGLAYLHEDCHPRIIHRDIKSANILLDEAWEAQVADFGLAKLANDTNTHVSTRVMGTFGYMAPEYATSGKLTDRSDVFSFGVVLLEIITGRRPVDPSQPLGEESLVEWARPYLVHALESGEVEQLVDPRLENNYSREEMLRMIEVAAACVRHSAPKRPRMVQVLRALDSDGEISDLSNGVKFGHSTVYDSCQYSVDIRNFRRMAFGSGDYTGEYRYSGESSAYTSEYDSRNMESSSSEFSSREAPSKPPNHGRPGEANYGCHEAISSRTLNPCMSDGSSSDELLKDERENQKR